MKEVLEQIWIRLISKTPKFFKWVQGIGVSLSALGVTLSAIEGIPVRFIEVSSDLIWIGAVIAAVSQFVVSNSSRHSSKAV